MNIRISPEEFELLLIIGSPKEISNAIHKTNKEQANKMMEHLLATDFLNKVVSEDIPKVIESLFNARHKTLDPKWTQQALNYGLNHYFKSDKIMGPNFTFIQRIKNTKSFSENENNLLPRIFSLLTEYTSSDTKTIDKVVNTLNLICPRNFDHSFGDMLKPLFFKLNQALMSQEIKGPYKKRLEGLSSHYRILQNFAYTDELKSIVHQGFLDSLKPIPTKDILSFYKSMKSESYFSHGYEDDYSLPNYEELDLLKKELDSRPHVMKPKDKKLVSLMSRHAKKKLSYPEAVALSKQLKKKT